MDFLKSQVTRAVAAFGKDVSLPFTIGAQVDNFNSSSLWTLHDGKKKVKKKYIKSGFLTKCINISIRFFI